MSNEDLEESLAEFIAIGLVGEKDASGLSYQRAREIGARVVLSVRPWLRATNHQPVALEEQLRQIHARHDLGHKLGAWPNACGMCEFGRALAADKDSQPARDGRLDEQTGPSPHHWHRWTCPDADCGIPASRFTDADLASVAQVLAASRVALIGGIESTLVQAERAADEGDYAGAWDIARRTLAALREDSQPARDGLDAAPKERPMTDAVHPFYPGGPLSTACGYRRENGSQCLQSRLSFTHTRFDLPAPAPLERPE